MIDTDRNQGMSNDRVALFIDVDNVLILSQNSGLPFYLSLIIDRVRQQGTIMSSKAYADWTSSLLRPFLGDFRASAVELVQLPTSMAAREHKNTADIQLAVDALEMVFLPGRPRYRCDCRGRPGLRPTGAEVEEIRRLRNGNRRRGRRQRCIDRGV